MIIHHLIFFFIAFMFTRNIDDVIALSLPYFCIYYLIYYIIKAYRYFFLSDPHCKEKKQLVYKPVSGSQEIFSKSPVTIDFDESYDNFVTRNTKHTEMAFEFDTASYFALGESNIFLTSKPNIVDKLTSRWPYRVGELDVLPYTCINFRIAETENNRIRLELLHKSNSTITLSPQEVIVATALEFDKGDYTLNELQARLSKN